MVGYCHPGQVTAHFHESLLNLVVGDAMGPKRIVNGGGRLGMQSSANISTARNDIVRHFLGRDAEWLWMVDTDMVFDPDTLERLVAAADPDTAPIVGGLCFGIEDGILFPTLYDIGGDENEIEFLRYNIWPPDQLMPVFGTGAACLLIHRRVLEVVQAKAFSTVHPWFQEREVMGKAVGEDLTFCMRAQIAGFPVQVHTGIKIGHVKSHVLIAAQYEAQQQMLRMREEEMAK